MNKANTKINPEINPEINIFSENIHENADCFDFDEKTAIDTAKKILLFYLNQENIFNSSCLSGYKFNCISFDILYCDNKKTHQINKEYRQKDYAADIITFAIFADSDEKFVFDDEINLGEIIISLDKVMKNTKSSWAAGQLGSSECMNSNHSPNSKFESELYFLISHGIMHLLGFDHQTNEDYTFIIKAQNDALRAVRSER